MSWRGGANGNGCALKSGEAKDAALVGRFLIVIGSKVFIKVKVANLRMPPVIFCADVSVWRDIIQQLAQVFRFDGRAHASPPIPS